MFQVFNMLKKFKINKLYIIEKIIHKDKLDLMMKLQF